MLNLRIAAFFIGYLLGVLINYLADELPIHRRLGIPVCRQCQTEFDFVNYIFWPRRCRTCGTGRLSRTWFLEPGMGLAAIWLLEYSPSKLNFGWSLLLLGFLILVTVIDIEHHLILHVVSLFGLLFGFYIGYILHGFIPTIIGGLVGFGSMLALYYLGLFFIKLSKRARGDAVIEDEAIGFGDVNLSGVIGLILGWPGVTVGLILAILIAGLISLLYLLWVYLRKGYHPNLAIPYGPFLTLSAFLLLYIRPIIF